MNEQNATGTTVQRSEWSTNLLRLLSVNKVVRARESVLLCCCHYCHLFLFLLCFGLIFFYFFVVMNSIYLQVSLESSLISIEIVKCRRSSSIHSEWNDHTIHLYSSEFMKTTHDSIV